MKTKIALVALTILALVVAGQLTFMFFRVSKESEENKKNWDLAEQKREQAQADLGKKTAELEAREAKWQKHLEPLADYARRYALSEKWKLEPEDLDLILDPCLEKEVDPDYKGLCAELAKKGMKPQIFISIDLPLKIGGQ